MHVGFVYAFSSICLRYNVCTGQWSVNQSNTFKWLLFTLDLSHVSMCLDNAVVQFSKRISKESLAYAELYVWKMEIIWIQCI